MKKQELATIVFCKYLKTLLFFICFLNSSIPTISRLENNKYCFAKTQISALLKRIIPSLCKMFSTIQSIQF